MNTETGYVSGLLTHFVGRHLATDEARFDLLVTVLESGRLRGSGKNRISVSGEKLSARKMFDPDVVCFCDIPVSSPSVITSKPAIRDRVKTGHTRSGRDRFI